MPRYYSTVKSFLSKSITAVAIATLSLGIAIVQNSDKATAHSGGLDSNGCHSGSQPYHCHRSSSGTPTVTTNTIAAIAETPTSTAPPPITTNTTAAISETPTASANSPQLTTPTTSKTPATSPKAKTNKFKNCVAVKKTYPNGIAKSRTAAKKHKKTPKVSSKIYNENKKLDINRDGTICEAK